LHTGEVAALHYAQDANITKAGFVSHGFTKFLRNDHPLCESVTVVFDQRVLGVRMHGDSAVGW
jgi:hypothetical protein